MNEQKPFFWLKKCTAVFIAVIILLQLFVPFSLTASAASDYAVIVTSSSVNVRSGPGTSYSQVGTVYLGEEYEYLGEAKDSGGTKWYKLRFEPSDYAWVSGKYAFKATPSDDYTQAFLESVAGSYNAVGAQIAVIENGVVTDTYNYGWATKNAVPMNSDSKIRAASLSKVAVAINAMKMQEQGIVDINANIGDYWGARPYKAVTLKSLLTHTSTLKALSSVSTRDGTLNQLKSSSSYSSGSVGASGSWMYNNYGAGIAGSTLEVASGTTLSVYAKSNIFAPLGIDAAMTSGLLDDTSKLATLYHSNGNVARNATTAASYKGSTTPGCNTSLYAGGLTCSARDYAVILAMLANDGTYNGVQILTPESVEAIEKKQFTKSENGGTFHQCMPLRYKANLYGESELYYHTGNAYGVLALGSYNPSTKDGVVVLTTGMSDSNTSPACPRDAQGIYAICGRLTEYVYKYHGSQSGSTNGEPTTTEPTTTTTTAPPVPIEAITIDKQELKLSIGDRVQLNTSVTPSNANEKIVWTSSGKCASVDQNGMITALGYGKATITAAAGSTSASCNVAVEPIIGLKMLGASIRIDDPYGTRFGIQLDKNEFYNNADIVEYGTLIIGSGTLGEAELTLDTQSILRIKAERVLSSDSSKLVYTGVLTDIPTSFFKTNVTARGYLIYRDADGSEHVYYTDTATRSFDYVARAAYEKYNSIAQPSDEERDIINKLIDVINSQ